MSGSRLELGEVGGAEGVAEGAFVRPHDAAVAGTVGEVLSEESPERGGERAGDLDGEGRRGTGGGEQVCRAGRRRG